MENEPLDIGQLKDASLDESAQVAMASLEKRLRRVAMVFYVIAGLTFASFLLSSLHLVSLFHSGLQRVLYTPLRLIFQNWALGSVFSYGFLIVLFIFLGVKLWQKKTWALSAGVVVYAADMLPLAFVTHEWVDVIIHGFFLILLVRGMAVVREMKLLAGPRGI